MFHSSLACSQALWHEQTAPLRERGYRVLAWDYPGHGSRLGQDAPSSVEDLAQLAEQRMEEAGIQTAHHVGLSLGGMVAMTLALRRPARVDSLTLISTSAHPGGPELWCRRAATALDEGMRPLADEFTGRWFTPHWAATHQRVIRDLNSDIMKTEPKAFSALCGAIAAFNVADTLSSIAVKTQVIVGEDDKGTGPDHARRIAGGIPGADLHILPGSHLVNLESAQAVNDIVEEVLP